MKLVNKIEIINIYGSIDNFQEIFPNDYDRFAEKEEIILEQYQQRKR